MRIQKIKDTFNDYRVEMSWGQLNAIHAALEKDHADPLADEAYAELNWYLQNVPGPGEDEEEYKEAREAEKQEMEAGDLEQGGEGGENDLLGQEVEGPEGPEGAEGPVGFEEPEAGGEEPESEADQFLERPPGEESFESLKPRKIRYKTHKEFGNHSRMVDGKYVKPSDAGGRSVGSKQIAPGEYPVHTRHRSRAELRNAAERGDED